VCANLISDLLISHRRRVLSRLKPGGILVLAGILESEFARVAAAYKDAGTRLVASQTGMGWRSGAFVYAPDSVSRKIRGAGRQTSDSLRKHGNHR